MKTLILPDVHGDLDMAAGLLRQVGALNESWERVQRDELRTVQLGDLCNCVGQSVVDDARCLDHVEEWFDVYLVGNHEHPYFGGPPFAGFWRDPVLAHRFAMLNATGLIRPCVVIDGVLVSHAGVTPEWGFDSAQDAEHYLNRWWASDAAHAPAFAAIGESRGGWTRHGGILWSDWSEPKAKNLRQIVGHTVGAAVRRVEHGPDSWAICLDLGGGKHSTVLAGALVDDGQVDIVFFDRADEAVA
jgi:hypothetical protein